MPPSSPFRSPLPPARASKPTTSSTSSQGLRRAPSVSPSGRSGARSEVAGAGGSGAGRTSVALVKAVKLRAEVEELERGLGGADPDEIVKRHIHLLHLYNERKDATNLLISRLATLEQVPAREIHARVGIEADD
ncbi:hypothetical protein JCM6882_000203 [Rhodosporidiobolus microsporus]